MTWEVNPNLIKCPYCGKEFVDNDHFVANLSEDETKVICVSCEKEFMVYVEIEVTYYSRSLYEGE